MEIFLLVVAVLVLTFVIKFTMMANHVLAGRYRKPATKLLNPEEVPATYLSLFAATEGALLVEGFEHSHYMQIENMERSDPSEIWYKAFRHPAYAAYALLSASRNPVPTEPVALEFITFFDDGTELKTVNNILHQFLGKAAHWEVQDPYAPTMASVWQAHRARLEGIISEGTKKPLDLEPAVLASSLENSYAALTDQIVSEGKFVQDTPGLYRLTMSGALQLTCKMMLAYRRSRSLSGKILKANSWVGPEAAAVLPVEVEIDAYRRIQNYQLGAEVHKQDCLRVTGWQYLLFVVFFAIASLDVEVALSFVSVVFLHEAGHALAAYGFGRRNLSLTPTMGAIMTGTSREPLRPWQSAVIALMGSLPGLVLGYFLVFAFGKSPFAMILIYINLVMLLPFVPLDGGMLLSYLFSGRSNYLSVIFFGTSALAALASAVYFKDPLFLALVVAMGFSTYCSVVVTRSLRAVKAKLSGISLTEADEPRVLAEVFAALRSAAYEKYCFVKKFAFAKALRDDIYLKPMALYAVLLWVAAYFWILYMFAYIPASDFYNNKIYPVVSKETLQDSPPYASVGMGMMLVYYAPEPDLWHYFNIAYDKDNTVCPYKLESHYYSKDGHKLDISAKSTEAMDKLERYKACLDNKGRKREPDGKGGINYTYSYYWWPMRQDAVTRLSISGAVMKEHTLEQGMAVEVSTPEGESYFYDKQTGYLLLYGYADKESGRFIVVEFVQAVVQPPLRRIQKLLPEIVKKLPLAPGQSFKENMLYEFFKG